MNFENWWRSEHGKTSEVTELNFQLMQRAYAAARADENEECAKVCEPQMKFDDPLTAWTIARLIRERQKSPPG